MYFHTLAQAILNLLQQFMICYHQSDQSREGQGCWTFEEQEHTKGQNRGRVLGF